MSDRVLKFAFSALLFVATFALLFYLFITIVQPAYFLAEYRQQYKMVFGKCVRATTSIEDANRNRVRIDSQHMERIYDSIRVELMFCHEATRIEQLLVSRGVDSAAIKHLQLDALNNQNLPMRVLVDKYIE